MSTKPTIQETLVSMGFQKNYITRAFKVYEKNYGHSYNIEVITEIIVRLQNKDKAKKAKNADNKDKQSKPQSSNKQNDNNKIAKQSPQSSSNKSSPNKPTKSPNKSKSSHQSSNSSQQSIKHMKKDRNQININVNQSKQSKPPKQPKIKPKSNSNTMKTDAPPKAYSGPNYGQSQPHNVPNMSAMNRSSSGNKMKRKPNKPPPNNPLTNQSHSSHSHHTHSQHASHGQQMSYNGNINNNMNVNPMQNKHIKSQSQSQSSQFKQQRPSPSAPPRFKPKDIVIYNGIESEINRIRNDGLIEITYPINTFIMQRNKATVNAKQIQKKKGGMNYNMQRERGGYNNNNAMNMNMNVNNRHMNNNNNNNNNSQRHSKVPNKSPQLQQSKPSNDSHMSNGSNNTSAKVTDDNNNNAIPSFQSHMTLEEANRLRIHDKIDHRDQVGRFVYATVSEKQGTNLKIHYDGWSRKWDTWSDFNLEIHRFAAAGSISKRPSHRFRQLKKGDYVDINPTQRHPGWKCGEIRRLDQKSGQVQVVYESLDKNYLYWAHLDNFNEIAEFTSKSGTHHQTQMEIIQKTQPQQQQKKEQQQQVMQQQQNIMKKEEPLDEMEAFERIRAKRFPRYPNEKINNRYGIGDWLEVQDTQTHQWITATVIDKENNWIVVHFDGWPSKYDQKIHALKHAARLRDLGSGLQETQEEKDIREEMNNFLCEVEQLSWKLIEVDADGNCLYRCFAINIYNDTTKHMSVRDECCKYMRNNREFFQNFIPDFDLRMSEKEQEYEWGDHVDITALSELYNVRVRVFEYDKSQSKLYMSFDQGEHEETVNLPLILLARHRKKHYNIITDPQAIHKRPLQTAAQRKDNISLKELRLREDARACLEEKDNENKEEKEDDENNNGNGIQNMNSNSLLSLQHNSVSVRNLGFNSNMRIVLEQSEFIGVVEMWNLSEPLGNSELKNIFKPLINKIYKKIEFQIINNQSTNNLGGISLDVLNRFWKQQFENQRQCDINCKRWIQNLKEKIPNQQFNINSCINTFNQTIVSALIIENLNHIIQSSRKRQSTIDVNRQQPMDIDQ